MDSWKKKRFYKRWSPLIQFYSWAQNVKYLPEYHATCSTSSLPLFLKDSKQCIRKRCFFKNIIGNYFLITTRNGNRRMARSRFSMTIMIIPMNSSHEPFSILNSTLVLDYISPPACTLSYTLPINCTMCLISYL